MDIKDILVATIFIALGLSFGYKAIEATFFGRTWYWTGFFLFGLVSPFFIHWPPGKRSLIKKIQGWWIHITLGPAFFLCALLFTASGAEKLGFNSAEIINYVLTLGRENAPSAITYSKESGYKFPILPRMQAALFKLISSPVKMEKGQSLTGQEEKDSQMQGPSGMPGDQSTPNKK